MKKMEWLRLAAACLCACTALVCSVLLIRYVVEYVQSRRVTADLAAQYYAESTVSPMVIDAPAAEPVVLATAAAEVVVASAPVLPTDVPRSTYDPFGGYPNNPTRTVSDRFKKLHQTNSDICAWVSIGSELDQPVVQRNNVYYLNRDYTGNHNSNGAIFLDEQIKLSQRPLCYILYGHNMKTEAMFGMLHKYDSISYLRAHPVVTFNTQYEDGEFAIFATGTLSLVRTSPRFLEFYNLPSAAGENRALILARLQQVSDFKIPLEVSPDDQLLILVTCVGDDSMRRFVAARRLRSGEDERTLNMTYLLSEPQ